MSQLDIVLVSYNTAEYTKRAIESVYAETHDTDFNIIMVDNDSKDNSVALISKHFPSVEIINTGANLGFAGGVNIGTKASQGEYILLLNPDTVILDGAIDKLMAYAKNNKSAGIINKHSGIWQKPLHKGLLLLHVFNKYLSLSLFSLFNKSKQATLSEWKIVFQKRHEWLRGYR